MLTIFTGQDWSTLPYEEFGKAVDNIVAHPVEPNPRDDVVTEIYAKYINWFAERNNIPTDRALRYDYILTREELTLTQFDLLLFRVGLSQNQALGHPFAYRASQTNKIVLLKAGDPKHKQNPTLTEKEKSLVGLCKKMVHEVWKE